MEVKELDFGQPEDNYTFNHVIALGEKADHMLRHLELNLGSWFEDELLTDVSQVPNSLSVSCYFPAYILNCLYSI